jgi:hypothetical protein
VAAALIQRLVRHHLVQQREEGCLSAMQPRARDQGEEDLLEDVLGLIRTAQQGPRPLQEGTPVALVEHRDAAIPGIQPVARPTRTHFLHGRLRPH